MSRLPLHPVAADDDRVAEVFASIRARGGEPSNFYRTLAHAPGLLQPWIGLTRAVLGHTRLDRGLVELCVLRVARRLDVAYVQAHHLPMARKAGVTEAHLAALDRWPESDEAPEDTATAVPDPFDARTRAALRYTDRLVDGLAGTPVGDETVADLRDELDDGEVVELTVTVAVYVATATVHRALAVDVEPDRAHA